MALTILVYCCFVILATNRYLDCGSLWSGLWSGFNLFLPFWTCAINRFPFFVSISFFTLDTVSLLVPFGTMLYNFHTYIFPFGASLVTFYTCLIFLVPIFTVHLVVIVMTWFIVITKHSNPLC